MPAHERLAAYNETSARPLKIMPADLGAKDWGDADGIGAWQEAHQLRGDGWFGPRSVLAARLAIALDKAGLAVDREKYRFTSGLYGRIDPPAPWSVVWHDTVTRSAGVAFEVLAKRGLSTHFLLDEDGQLYQCADPGSTWALHAAAFNQESIGVDIVTLLDPALAEPKKHGDDQERLARVVERPWSGSRERGQAIDYTAAQKRVIPLLARVLSDVYSIPRRMLAGPRGFGEKHTNLSDRIYRGHIGHGQWSSKRWDGNLAVEMLTAPGAKW